MLHALTLGSWVSVTRVFSAAAVGALIIGLTTPGRPTMAEQAEPVAPLDSNHGLLVRTKTEIIDAYGKVPLSFEVNQGESDERVDFISRGNGYTLFLASGDAVLTLHNPTPPTNELMANTSDASNASDASDAVVRIAMVGANPSPQVAGLDQLPGKINYFTGNDPSHWRVGVSTYAKVAYQSVYPGVDLVYYGNQGRLEYDLIVAAGADPTAVRFAVAGADSLELDAAGDLLMSTANGAVRQRKPVVYQERDGVRQEIASSYVLSENNEIGLELSAWDASRPLVIDPALVYSTYLGGNGADQGNGIAVDASGSAYIVGTAGNSTFPTTTGTIQPAFRGSADAFVAKLNPAGTALLYSTFLGGLNTDFGQSIAIDGTGNAYIAGYTSSPDFPTTPGAFQTTLAGSSNIFVTKLNPTGSGLLYSTYVGSGGNDGGFGVAIDGSGAAYVVGKSNASNFPTTAGSFQPTKAGAQNAVISKLNPTGSALAYSTYLGGTGSDFAQGVSVDSSGNAYVTGYTSSADFPTTLGAFQAGSGGGFDAFVTKMNSTGSALLYSTYLGGANDDFGCAIALDISGNAYVTGQARSLNFPTTPGSYQTGNGGGSDAFVAKLNPSGAALVYSTLLGGSDNDFGCGIAIDATGNAYITGQTRSANFPAANAFQAGLGGLGDAFVAKVNPAGSGLVYSSYLGGNGDDFGFGIAVDGTGNAYVTGLTSSSNFPTAAALQPAYGGGGDGFVAKIGEKLPPATLVLTPAAGLDPVGSSHSVTATVKDATGQPTQGITVRFSVTGSVTTSGSCVTDINGQCAFSYAGPQLPGADAIQAFADTNNNGTRDVGEPIGTATEAWTLPATTPGQVTGGGQIHNSIGTGEIAFGFNAQSTATGVKGNCNVVDPVADVKIKCLAATSLVQSGTHATFFGDAAINGVSTTYRIDVDDLAEPGAGSDTFKIQTGSGYAASGVLTHGNIQIHN